MSEYKGVLVLCETAEGKLSQISLELLGAGSKLAQESGQELGAVLIGNNIHNLAQEAIAFGAAKVYIVDDPLLKDYLTEAFLNVMDKVTRQVNPQVLLIGQTQVGRDLAPRLACRLNTAVSLDCIALAIDPPSKKLLQTKPVYGGNAQATFICESYPQMATLRSKAFSAAERNANRQGEIISIPAGLDAAGIRTKVLDRKVEAAAGIKLEDAKVIVCGGRGIGSADGFKQLEQLATLLKGTVGASRPPCDNHWVSDNLQIGLTGKIVSPDLYIGVALSGSSQHLSGCSGSRVIVAINKDEQANIFKVAHYGIVADWKKVLPAFTARVKDLVSA
jgi:electron transfer flavoprotein alpha subunit